MKQIVGPCPDCKVRFYEAEAPCAKHGPMVGSPLECGSGSRVPARPIVRMPIPGPWPEPERIGQWPRLRAWLRYQPAAWPSARVVQR